MKNTQAFALASLLALPLILAGCGSCCKSEKTETVTTESTEVKVDALSTEVQEEIAEQPLTPAQATEEVDVVAATADVDQEAAQAIKE